MRNFKKLIAFVIVMLILLQGLSFSPIVVYAVDWTGYIPISNAADLDAVRNDLSGKYYLTCDIILTPSDFEQGGAFYNGGTGWQPIGNNFTPFTGTFDGNGHTISGLHCIVSLATANVNAGLFGYNKGNIQNLGMVNNYINCNSTSSSYAYVGGITGYNTGTILNAYNASSVTGPSSSSNYSYVGGVAGYSTGTITNCSNSGRVAGPTTDYAYTGGVAGYNYGSINNSNNTGSVSGRNVGGVAGYNSHGTLNNCYNTGKIDGIGWLGGIAGYNNSGTISKCYNTSRINSTYSDVGGIVGYDSSGNINNCYNTGSLCGNYAGGIAGYSRANISNCYNIGSVYGDTAGGIVGTNYLGTLVNCYFLNINSAGAGDGSATATSLTLEQMKSMSSYSDFDFTDNWTIDSSAAYKFPILKNVPHIEMEENTIGFSGGNGSVYNPYKITNKKQLDNVRNDLTAAYVLVADIVFNEADFEQGGTFNNGGADWKPLGADYSNPFAGIFDGKGHTISGLVCNVTSSSYSVYAGLFGYNNGVIKNTGMVGNSIRGYFNGSIQSAYTTYAGGITGQNNGSISNCYNTGSVNSESLSSFPYSGGITGLNYGSINNCYNTGSIGGVWSAGIAGKNSRNINNCYNTGISRSGIASDNDHGGISNCYYLNITSKEDSNNGTSLTIDQMKDPDSFSGFNFENIWTMNNNTSYKLPTLQGMTVVNNRTVSCISMSGFPHRTSYFQGQDLDLNGAQIYVVYNDGTTQNLNVTLDMVNGYDRNSVGAQTISVNFGNHATTFTVNVSEIRIYFNSNSGSAIGSQTTAYNNLLAEPAIPTREGYTFGGWYKDASLLTKWNFSTDRVADNITLYAMWALSPHMPTTVKAVSTSFNSINISWTPVADAKGYEVYRLNSNTGTYTLEGVTTAAQYNNLALMPNTIYYYKVRAFVPSGSVIACSNFSPVVSAKPIPEVPGSFKAASSNYNSVLTSWRAVKDASGYEVYRSTSSTGIYKLVTNTTGVSYSNTSLATGATYFYKMRAYILLGTTKIYGNFTSVVSARPIPNVPNNFAAVRASSSCIKLTWSGVAGALGYEIHRATSSTGTYRLIKSTSSLSYTNTCLKRGVTYYYKVRAYRVVGKTKIYSGWTVVKYARP